MKGQQPSPPIIPITEWKPLTGAADLPESFNHGHIYHWLVESIETSDNDQATEKPLRRGEQYRNSGFVNEIYLRNDGKCIFMKTTVKASMKNEQHNVLVTLSARSGSVIDGNCDCKASALGRCSHVAALLLTALHKPACTDLPCNWKKGSKRKDPGPVHSKGYGRNFASVLNFDPRPKKDRGVSNEQVNNFLAELQTANYKTGVISMWQTQLMHVYEDYTLTNDRKQELGLLRDMLKQNLSVNEQCQMIAGTECQSGSDLWHGNRCCRLTASTAKETSKISESLPDGPSDRMKYILQKHMWNMNNVSTSDMLFGIEKEDCAREEYKNILSKRVPGSTVEKTGMWVNRDFPEIGCSPDGLVYDPTETTPDGLLEIKILKFLQKCRPDSVNTAIQNGDVTRQELRRSCVNLTEQGTLKLKEMHQYYYQVQLQMAVTCREWCDFVLWSEKGGISVERIQKNPVKCEELVNSLRVFWDRVVSAEFFEMRTPRNLKPFIL